jgi:hypothetical protein
MTAFRPQTEAYGAPFERTEIPDAEQQDPGVGIRRNGDDDDENEVADYLEATVAGENDLIELELETRLPDSPGVEFRLTRSTADITAWYEATKGTELFAVGPEAVLTPGGPVTSVWAEWVAMGTGPAGADLELSVWDATHGQKAFFEEASFYTFTSVVIALGGEDQVPTDPPDPNFGTFVVARSLYREGYDVHMYDEDNVAADGSGAAFAEVERAVNERGVTQVAVFGYSHGGGSTHDLSGRVQTEMQLGVHFTSYVDAIRNTNDYDMNQELRRPPGSQHHVNQYQHGTLADGWLDGGPSDPAADWELDVETTAWGADATHHVVDDYHEVRDQIETRLRNMITR